MADDPDDLEKLAEALAEQVLALKAEIAQLRGSIPAPQEPIAPIVQVPPAEVVVNIPPQEAPQINVLPAGPAINLNAESIALNAELQPVVDKIGELMEAASTRGEAGTMAALAAIKEIPGFIAGILEKQAKTQEARDAQRESQWRAFVEGLIDGVVKSLTAPRSIVTDSDGNPTGIKIGKSK